MLGAPGLTGDSHRQKNRRLLVQSSVPLYTPQDIKNNRDGVFALADGKARILERRIRAEDLQLKLSSAHPSIFPLLIAEEDRRKRRRWLFVSFV